MTKQKQKENMRGGILSEQGLKLMEIAHLHGPIIRTVLMAKMEEAGFQNPDNKIGKMITAMLMRGDMTVTKTPEGDKLKLTRSGTEKYASALKGGRTRATTTSKRVGRPLGSTNKRKPTSKPAKPNGHVQSTEIQTIPLNTSSVGQAAIESFSQVMQENVALRDLLHSILSQAAAPLGLAVVPIAALEHNSQTDQ